MMDDDDDDDDDDYDSIKIKNMMMTMMMTMYEIVVDASLISVWRTCSAYVCTAWSFSLFVSQPYQVQTWAHGRSRFHPCRRWWFRLKKQVQEASDEQRLEETGGEIGHEDDFEEAGGQRKEEENSDQGGKDEETHDQGRDEEKRNKADNEKGEQTKGVGWGALQRDRTSGCNWGWKRGWDVRQLKNHVALSDLGLTAQELALTLSASRYPLETNWR